MSKDSSKTESSIQGRIIMQQCTSAKLQTNANNKVENPEYVTINRGVVAYVCFMNDANEETATKMARTVCNVKLSRPLDDSTSSSLVSVTDLPGDILVVPQATLGGKQKGNRMQYHGNISKVDGETLYNVFVQTLNSLQAKSQICKEANVKTQCGTYGNLQVLSVETNGPYTHVLNF